MVRAIGTGIAAGFIVAAYAAGCTPAPAAEASPSPVSVTCPLVVAHRAAAPGATENTTEGIRKANADWVEIDVQRTKDGFPVLQHDTSFRRATNVEQVYPGKSPWYVKNMTWSQVNRLTVNGGSKVPTLDEALDAAQAAGKGVQIEGKAPKLYPGLSADITQAMQGRSIPMQVISFDERFLRYVTMRDSGAEVVFILNRQPRVVSSRGWLTAIAVAHKKLDRAYVNRAANYGIDTQAYVPNSTADAQRMERLGVSGFTSDAPVRTATALNCR